MAENKLILLSDGRHDPEGDLPQPAYYAGGDCG